MILRVKFAVPVENDVELTTAANYTITGPSTITVSSVSVVNNNCVDITVNELLMINGSYSLVVQNLTPLSTTTYQSTNSISFVGNTSTFGLVSAIVFDQNHIDLTFSDSVDPTGVGTTSNYTIIGDSTLTIASAALISASVVRVTLNEFDMLNLGNYNIYVSNLQSVGGLQIDPSYYSYPFIGVGLVPQMLSATALDPLTVRVVFTEPMVVAELETFTNYTFNNGLVASAAVKVGGGPFYTSVDVTVNEMSDFVDYTITGDASLIDLSGVPLDPLANSYIYAGQGYPQLLSATAVDPVTVEFIFNENMNVTQLETFANYTFDGGIVSSAATKIGVGPGYTTVDVTVSEMSDFVDYTATCAAALIDLDGNAMNPSADQDTFAGQGYPQVVSATATTTEVTVIFNENMSDVGLTTNGNYTFTCPPTAPITVASVHKINATTVHVVVSGEMLTGVNNYTITVNNVVDSFGHIINPSHKSSLFNGLGVAPQLVTAEALDPVTVRFTFDEPMNVVQLETFANYLFNNGVTSSAAVKVGGGPTYTVVDVTVSEMSDFVNYTATCAAPLVDLAGNTVDLAHKSYIFAGQGYPQIASASAEDYNVVRVEFNEDMATGAGGTLLTLAGNYDFDCPVGAVITVGSVARVVGVQNMVDITTVGEMLTSGDYTINISNVIDTDGNSINSGIKTYDFHGLGLAPHVESAASTSTTNIRVTFSEDMGNSGIDTHGNYTFTVYPAGAEITVSEVARVGGVQNQVDVTVSGEMKTGVGNYTIHVDNVVDLAGNTIDPMAAIASFDGQGVAPQVSSATSTATDTVRVVFNENMSDTGLTTNGNYSFTCPAGATITVGSVAKINATTVDITTSGEMLTGVNNYTVTVINVKDTAGNVIDAAHDEDTFNGMGTAPQVSSVSISDHGHSPDWFTLQLNFNENLKDEGAVTTVTNYEITGPARGYAMYNPDTATFGADHAKVLLHCDKEMANSETYTILAKNLHDVVGHDLDLDHDTATVSGANGTQPIVDGGTTWVNSYEAEVHYSENMKDNAALTNTANYTVQNTDTLEYYDISEILVGGSDFVTLVMLDEMPIEVYIRITVATSTVCDLAGNYINPAGNSMDIIG